MRSADQSVLKPLGALWRRCFPPKPGSLRERSNALNQRIADWKAAQQEELDRLEAERDHWKARATDLHRTMQEHRIPEPADVLAHERPDIHPRRRT